MDTDIVEYRRSIYTVWDFLGDVGGLYDMLKLLAQPVLAFSSLLLGSGLDQYLVESIFKVQKKMRGDHRLSDFIRRRKPFKVSFCNVFCDRNNRKLE